MHGDIQAVFDTDPPDEMVDEIEEEDTLDDDIWGNGLLGEGGGFGGRRASEWSRRPSEDGIEGRRMSEWRRNIYARRRRRSELVGNEQM